MPKTDNPILNDFLIILLFELLSKIIKNTLTKTSLLNKLTLERTFY